MSRMFDFSIIIPHYNNAEDLARCLASIPQRDDLQVIIVDDNSDPAKVDFANFPGLGRPNTEIVFSKGDKGKGPGYARNVGIEKAEGRWIIFSDSDDYFMPGLEKVLDQYKDNDADVVFFKSKKQDLEGSITDYRMFNDLIDEADAKGDCEPIAYHFPCPWAKFIKKDFLINNGIRYQQITGGDDILFSLRIAVNLKRYALSDTFLYCVVDRPGSLTRNTRWQILDTYTRACCEAYKMLKPVSKETIAYNWTASWWGRLWHENKFRALAVISKVSRSMGFIKMLHCFKKALKVGKWDWEKRER